MLLPTKLWSSGNEARNIFIDTVWFRSWPDLGLSTNNQTKLRMLQANSTSGTGQFRLMEA